MQTLTNRRWGDSGLPFPALEPLHINTQPGANLFFRYGTGGTTDYTSGSVVVSGLLKRVV